MLDFEGRWSHSVFLSKSLCWILFVRWVHWKRYLLYFLARGVHVESNLLGLFFGRWIYIEQPKVNFFDFWDKGFVWGRARRISLEGNLLDLSVKILLFFSWWGLRKKIELNLLDRHFHRALFLWRKHLEWNLFQWRVVMNSV